MMKIAIIGAGFIGGVHAVACQNSKELQLVAVSDINETVGKEFSQKYDCAYYKDAEAMLVESDAEVVVICLPTSLHKQFILLAAKHKKHILCEKPVTLTLEEMDEILAAVNTAGVRFMVAQVIRFWPEYVHIKKMYNKGEFGEIKMIYANRLAQHPNWTKWHDDPKISGGGLFDLHLHDIDMAMSFFGDVKKVYAVGWKSPTGCYDHVITSLSFENGVNAVIEGSSTMSDNYPFTMSMRLVGETKTAEYTMSAGFNIEDIGSSCRSLYTFEKGQQVKKVEIDLNEDAYQTQLEYFVNCIKSNKSTEIITPEASREVIRIMVAIQQSIETGLVIDTRLK